MKVHCPECGWKNDMDPIPFADIPALHERLEPGGVVPAGVCPAPPPKGCYGETCGSLVYLVDKGYVAELEHNRDALLGICKAVFEIIDSTYPHDDDGNRLDGDSPVSGGEVVEMLCNLEYSLADAIEQAQQRRI